MSASAKLGLSFSKGWKKGVETFQCLENQVGIVPNLDVTDKSRF